jgi:hypothetical protein
MTEHNDIQITRVPSDPPHYRASDGWWSLNGEHWIGPEGDYTIDGKYRAAFHAQILTPTAPEQPERAKVAKVGDKVRDNDRPDVVGEVVAVRKNTVDVLTDSLLHTVGHGDYTIVSPPTATGDKITERDGVWESKGQTIRALVVNGEVVVVMDDNCDGATECDGTWKRDLSGLEGVVFTLISTDPAELTEGWKGEA